MYEKYLGAIHIHTKFSDGTGDVQLISKEARKSGLNWIIITDHNSLDVTEGIYNGVYVIRGEEISPLDKNHYLAFGIDKIIEPSDDAQVYINKVREMGGFGFSAHPDESTKRKNKYKPIIWENKNIIPDGIEIWNWFSNWGDNLNDSNIFKLAYSYFFKNKIITPPSEETLRWWDELNIKFSKIIPAIGGVDAHAFKIYKYIIPLSIFPYKTYFDTITNVIMLKEKLSEDFGIAKQQILNSIKNGNNFIINRKICDCIPEINITNNSKTAGIGDTFSLTKDTYLCINSNKTTDVKIIHNSELFSELSGKNLKIPITQAGKYRIELSYLGKKYAYSNPINVIEG